MSPAIDFPPDFLGMFKQQVSPVPSAVATDLEMLCSTLNLLQANEQADLNALSGCLSRLSDWLKNQQEAAPGDNSGWTSMPFGVKGMGGMITCRNDQHEVVFSQDGNGQPYLGMWHSRMPGEADRDGSFKIKTGDGGTQLILEGSHPLQVSLPALGAVEWGSMDTFFQTLNISKQTNQPEAAQLPPPPVQGLPVLPTPPKIPDMEASENNTDTILAKQVKRQPLPIAPLPSENARSKPAPGEQPALINPEIWQCTCGSKNAGLFCPKCGSEKPTSTVVVRSVSVQPTVCKQCGEVLTPGAKFCRNCGNKV